jgi:hypothetical protein
MAGKIPNAVGKRLQESIIHIRQWRNHCRVRERLEELLDLTESFAPLHDSRTDSLEALYFAAQLSTMGRGWFPSISTNDPQT